MTLRKITIDNSVNFDAQSEQTYLFQERKKVNQTQKQVNQFLFVRKNKKLSKK